MFTITSSKEYYAKLRVNLSDLQKIADAQITMYDTGFEQKNYTTLTNLLTAYSGVLSFAFMAPTAVDVSGTIAGIVATIGSGLPTLEYLVKEGHWQLSRAIIWFKANPQYDMIEINLPFIQYTDATHNESIRFVEAVGDNSWGITAVHVPGSSGWQLEG